MTLTERFGSNVAKERNRLGISQEELGKAAGIQRDTVQKIEAGKRSVRLLTLLSLAEALGVDPCVLLEGLRP